MAHIHRINVSAGGVPKLPVPHARILPAGVEGDAQHHTQIHGGPERAVCLYALECIEKLRAAGHPIVPGSIGENLTVAGLDWGLVVPDAVFVIGEGVRLRVTRYTKPCKTIRGSFSDGDFRRVLQDLSPGMSRVYTRVLSPGLVRVGDAVTLELPRSA